MYEVIDVNNNLNMKTMEYATETRASLATNYEGDGVDKGHCVQAIWGTDKLGLMRISQGAGIGTSPEGCYISHSNAVEIEYVLSSKAKLEYPDGTALNVYPGDCSCSQPGQPHRMETTGREHMQLAVFLSCQPSVCDRVVYDTENEKHKCNKWDVKTCEEVPSIENEDPLVDIKVVYEGNDKDVCFCQVTLKPGATVPMDHFISNTNCDEIVLVKEGNGLAIYPDKTYPLYSDMSMYNYAGQPYKYINTGDSDLVLLNLYSKKYFNEIERNKVKLNYTE